MISAVLEVRRVPPENWRALREVRLAALAEAPYAFASTSAREEAYDEARWRQWVTGAACFLAWRDGEPVGISAGIRADGAPADERHVVSMWVRPEARGSGVAPALVTAVREWAASDRAACLTLWVVDGNDRASRFYARFGFISTGERQPLPSNPGVEEEKLRLPL